MAFHINWPSFSKEFLLSAKHQLSSALNKGDKPDNIVDNITVSEDRFKGIFKLNYSGDGHITLQTKVQANPLNPIKTNTRINHKVPPLSLNRRSECSLPMSPYSSQWKSESATSVSKA
jgi:distribution and morphology protein 34